MLLERCEPGTVLHQLPEPQQDVVIAGLLRSLWREPPTPNPFRPLSMMMACWADETLAEAANWLDAGLMQEGLTSFWGTTTYCSRQCVAGHRSACRQRSACPAAALACHRSQALCRRSGLRRHPTAPQLPAADVSRSPRNDPSFCRTVGDRRRACSPLGIRPLRRRVLRRLRRRHSCPGQKAVRLTGERDAMRTSRVDFLSPLIW